MQFFVCPRFVFRPCIDYRCRKPAFKTSMQYIMPNWILVSGRNVFVCVQIKILVEFSGQSYIEDCEPQRNFNQ